MSADVNVGIDRIRIIVVIIRVTVYLDSMALATKLEILDCARAGDRFSALRTTHVRQYSRLFSRIIVGNGRGFALSSVVQDIEGCARLNVRS